MAQTVNATPIIISDDGSTKFAANTINQAVDASLERQRYQAALALKQREQNQALFGDTARSIGQLYEKANNLPKAVRDNGLQQDLLDLSRNINNPNFYKIAAEKVATRANAVSSINNFYTEAIKAGNDLSAKFDLNQPGVLSALHEATNNPQFDYGQDPIKFMTDLVASNKEVLTDREKVFGKASGYLTKLSEGKDEVYDVALDPSGKNKKVINVTSNFGRFDRKEERVDPNTGQKYPVSVLDTQKYNKFNDAWGRPVDMDILSEGKYKVLNDDQTEQGATLRNAIDMKAHDLIQDHNANVFAQIELAQNIDLSPAEAMKRGKELSLTVSPKNAANFSQVPGFVDPNIDANLEVFKRAAAASLIKGASGLYEKDNKKRGSKFVSQNLFDNPKATGTGDGSGEVDYIKSYERIYNQANIAKSKGFGLGINQLQDNDQDIVLTGARKKIGVNSVNGADLIIKKQSDGGIGVYTVKPIMSDKTDATGQPIQAYPGNTLVYTLSKEGTDLKANKELGKDAKEASFKDRSTPGGKTLAEIMREKKGKK